jgi:hypothetical protein
MFKRAEEVVYRYDAHVTASHLLCFICHKLFIAGMYQEPNSFHYLLMHSLYISSRIRNRDLMLYGEYSLFEAFSYLTPN